jgi:hypothetical protein
VNSRLVRGSPKRGTRERIAGVASIQIEPNTSLIPLVQARTGNTRRRRNSAATANLEVQALRVELRAIIVARTVQSNDLVADDVVARFKVARYGGRGREVVG